jgi:hypothetical protein
MLDAVNNSDYEDARAIARHHALRRAERFDMVVASTLLVLLIFGWAIRLAPIETWPRGDFLVAFNTRHA